MPIVLVDKDLEEIIPEFLSYRKDDIVNLKEAIKAEDYKTVKVIGHRLGGNAAGYGFHYLGEIGIKIETAALKEDLGKIEKLTSDYEEYFKNIKIEYK